jgi:hypothetical protein
MSSNVLATVLEVGPSKIKVRLRTDGRELTIERPQLPPHQDKFAKGDEIELLPNGDGTFRYLRHASEGIDP